MGARDAGEKGLIGLALRVGAAADESAFRRQRRRRRGFARGPSPAAERDYLRPVKRPSYYSLQRAIGAPSPVLSARTHPLP